MSTQSQALFAVAGLISLALNTPVAGAAPLASHVQLTSPPCETLPYNDDALRKALDVEVRAAHLSAETAVTEASIVVSVSECSADATELQVSIALPTAPTVSSVNATLSLEGTPREARTRTLALAIAELLRGAVATYPATAERTATAPSKTRDPHATSAQIMKSRAQEHATAKQQTAPFLFYLAYATLEEVQQTNALHGVGLGVELAQAGTSWRPRLTGEAEFGSVVTNWGSVKVRTFAVSLEASTCLLDHPKLTLGPTLKLLVPTATAQSNLGISEAPQTKFALAPSSALSVAAPLSDRFQLTANLELGYFWRRAIFLGGGEPLVKFSGLHTGVALGFAIR